MKSGAEDFILGKDKEQIAESDTITIIVSLQTNPSSTKQCNIVM